MAEHVERWPRARRRTGSLSTGWGGWSGAAEMDKVRQLNLGKKHQLVLVVGGSTDIANPQ